MNVGPVAVKDPSEGRFAAAVKPVKRDSLTKVSPSGAPENKQQQQHLATPRQDTKSSQQSDFKAFLESRTRKSIYDELPPPSHQ